ncbi:MDR family MFS transporter [Paenibacillus jiagnxiensis]|uniref:MDR family MFS transporter n=1 Tax=Paenibacillus jiagnxiensis TaxID=3228926 RepID=UPI0033B4381F
MLYQIRSIHPLAWTIMIGTVCSRMAMSMSLPFLAIYLTQSLGASPSQTGFVTAVSSLAGLAASFWGGYAADRLGRKTVLLLSACGWAAVFAGFAAADQLWMFFAVNALNGVCRSVFEPASRALLSDVTPPEQRHLVFNMRYAAINAGFMLGPLIGIRFGAAGSASLFLIPCLVYLLYGAVLAVQFRRHSPSESAPGASGEEHAFPGMLAALRITSADKLFMLLLFGSLLTNIGFGQFSTTLPQHLTMSPYVENGPALYGYMLTLNAVTVLVVQYPVMRCARYLPPMLLLMAGSVFVSGSMLMFGLFTSFGWLLLGVLIYSIGEVLVFTLSDTLVDKLAPKDLRATYFGVMGLSNTGYMLGPLLGGLLLDAFGTDRAPLVFSLIACTSTCGLPFLFVAYRKWQRPLTGPKQEIHSAR